MQPKAKKTVATKTAKPVAEKATDNRRNSQLKKHQQLNLLQNQSLLKKQRLAPKQEAIDFEETSSKPEKKTPQLTEEQRKAIIEKANQNNPNHPSYIGPKTTNGDAQPKKEIKNTTT